MKTTYSIINEFAEKWQAESYLELTNSQNSHFKKISINKKNHIDIFNIPNFIVSSEEDILKYLIKKTGNLYFDIICLNQIKNYNDITRLLSIILSLSHINTLFFINNIFPPDPFSCAKNREKAIAIKERLGLEGSIWIGDSYKAYYLIHDLYPTLSYCTFINKNFSQLILWQASPATRPIFCKNFDMLNNLDYFKIFEHPYIFMPVRNSTKLYKLIGLSLNPSLYQEPEDWKKLIFTRCISKKETILRQKIQFNHI